MFSSANENVGFSAIGEDELEKVNGGVIPLIVYGIAGFAVGVTMVALVYNSSSK